MEFTDQALLLRTGEVRERDLWMRVLTPSRGVFTAFAFGGRVSRRRFCGCLEPLSLVRFRFASNKTGQYLQACECDVMRRYGRLKAAPQRLGMAANCVDFIQRAQAGPESARPTFETLAQGLAALAEAPDQPDVDPLWPVLFRAKLTFASGYAPALDACQVCGKGVEQIAAPAFDVAGGKLACGGCRNGSRAGMAVSREALGALRGVADGHPKDWTTLNLDRHSRQQLYTLVESFIGYHLGL